MRHLNHWGGVLQPEMSFCCEMSMLCNKMSMLQGKILHHKMAISLGDKSHNKMEMLWGEHWQMLKGRTFAKNGNIARGGVASRHHRGDQHHETEAFWWEPLSHKMATSQGGVAGRCCRGEHCAIKWQLCRGEVGGKRCTIKWQHCRGRCCWHM